MPMDDTDSFISIRMDYRVSYEGYTLRNWDTDNL